MPRRQAASIEDPVVINEMLTHLRGKGRYRETAGLPESRAPPQQDFFNREIHSRHTSLRRGKVAFGQMTGVCLEKLESWAGDR